MERVWPACEPEAPTSGMPYLDLQSSFRSKCPQNPTGNAAGNLDELGSQAAMIVASIGGTLASLHGAWSKHSQPDQSWPYKETKTDRVDLIT